MLDKIRITNVGIIRGFHSINHTLSHTMHDLINYGQFVSLIISSAGLDHDELISQT